MSIKDWYRVLRCRGHSRIISLPVAILYKIDTWLIKFK